MQFVHVIHGTGCRQGHAGAFQMDFDESQIGESDHAGEDVTTDFAVRPVSNGQDAHEVVIFGLTEHFFDDIAIQSGLNDVERAPPHEIGDEDVLAEAIDMPSDAIVIFSKAHGPSLGELFEVQVVQIVGKVELFA